VTDSLSRRARWAVLGTLVVLTACGLVLRCLWLRQHGMWWDEAALWSDALTGRRNANEAPLNTWLTHLTMVLLRRDDALALHVPALVFGTLTVPAAFRLGRATAGVACGLATALLVTVSPCLLAFSQEARPYALLILVTTLQVAAGLEFVAEWTPRRLAWLAALSCVAAATHLVAVPFSLGLGSALVLALGWHALRDRPQRRRWLVRAALLVGAGGLALALGSSWTLFRPSFKPVMAGPYQFGVAHLLRFALVRATTFAFGIGPRPYPWGPNDTIAAIYVGVALAGVMALSLRRHFDRALALVAPSAALLAGLYLQLGDKSVWGWMRYATPMVVPLFALTAAGLTASRRVWISSPLVLALAAINARPDSGVPMWAANAQVTRGTEWAAAATEIARRQGQLRGVVFIEQRSIYGEETDRLSASYALYRSDALPLYHVRTPGGIFRVELRRGPGTIAVPFLTDEPAGTLPDGDYAVFDGWVKMGCGRYSLAASPTPPPPGVNFVLCRAR
jgi:hypothetical protein